MFDGRCSEFRCPISHLPFPFPTANKQRNSQKVKVRQSKSKQVQRNHRSQITRKEKEKNRKMWFRDRGKGRDHFRFDSLRSVFLFVDGRLDSIEVFDGWLAGSLLDDDI